MGERRLDVGCNPSKVDGLPRHPRLLLLHDACLVVVVVGLHDWVVGPEGRDEHIADGTERDVAGRGMGTDSQGTSQVSMWEEEDHCCAKMENV